MSRTTLAAAAAAAFLLTAPMAEASPFEFRGFYAGGHLGYAESSADVPGASPIANGPGPQIQGLIFVGGGLGDVSGGGLMGGLQAGYNFVWGNFVWGVETDLSGFGADADGACPFAIGLNCDFDIGPVATLRARVGYARDKYMAYVTGGVAGADIEFTASAAGAGPVLNADDGDIGWTVGAGVEYMIGDIVGVKVEYRYMRFDDIGLSSFGGPLAGDVDIDSHVIMGGVNFHF